jgi:hypothetical protein
MPEKPRADTLKVHNSLYHGPIGHTTGQIGSADYKRRRVAAEGGRDSRFYSDLALSINAASAEEHLRLSRRGGVGGALNNLGGDFGEQAHVRAA